MCKLWRKKKNLELQFSKQFLDVLFNLSCWKVLQLPISCVHTAYPDGLHLVFEGGLSSIWSQGGYLTINNVKNSQDPHGSMGIHLKPHLQLPGCSLRADTPLRVAAPSMGSTGGSKSHSQWPLQGLSLLWVTCLPHSTFLVGWAPFCSAHVPPWWLQTGASSLHIYLWQPKHTQAVCACCEQGRDCSKPALHSPLHNQVWATPSWRWCLHRGFAGRFWRDPSVMAISGVRSQKAPYVTCQRWLIVLSTNFW